MLGGRKQGGREQGGRVQEQSGRRHELSGRQQVNMGLELEKNRQEGMKDLYQNYWNQKQQQEQNGEIPPCFHGSKWSRRV